jgi:hypothetical protein
MARSRTGLSLSLYTRRKALTRGLFGEDRFWRLVYQLRYSRKTASRLFGRPQRVWRPLYTTVYGVRLARKVLGVGPRIVSIEKLRPGQWVRVEAIDPATLSPAERKLWRR